MWIKNWHIKKIDKLILGEFIPPFIMAFLIAMFVLMMQFLWLYIDDIAGKGVGLFVLAEMIYYMALSLIPMALPIAILLSSVMVFGTLAEKYELPSLKTAGIPLMRVMRAPMVFAALVAVSSFLCSNYVIPYANLKSRSRLYDIKKQKPALYLESGVFNDDFQDYSIRIGRKHADNKTIEDVMIDEDRSTRPNEFSFIRAKRGEMFVTDNGRYFIMNLEDGHQYQKSSPTNMRSKFPFIRTKFNSWSKTFDLGEFDLNRTDENLFKTYHAMLSTNQLARGIDSINLAMSKIQSEVYDETWNKMKFIDYQAELDTVNMKRIERAAVDEIRQDTSPIPFNSESTSTGSTQDDKKALLLKQDKQRNPRNAVKDVVVDQPHLDSLEQKESVIYTFAPDRRILFLENSRNAVRSSKNFNYEYRQKMANEIKRKQSYTYQMHSKYGFALVCFIFLFVGAPMGAIVRKGGFGYPLLVAIFFFMFFVVLTKLFDKLSRSNTVDAILAAWLPCAILFPLGLFLTVKAMNDSKLLNTDRWLASIQKFLRKKKSTEAGLKTSS